MHLRHRHKDATRSYNNYRNSWFKIKLKPLTFVKKRHVFVSIANKTYASLYSNCNVPSQIEVKERFLTRSRISVCRPVVQTLTLVFSCFLLLFAISCLDVGTIVLHLALKIAMWSIPVVQPRGVLWLPIRIFLHKEQGQYVTISFVKRVS